MQVLQGVKFEVEPQEDHTFEVEPHENVDHVVGSQEVQTQDLIYYHLACDKEQHSAWEIFSYREDSNEAAFAVAVVNKIYAYESLTFNNTISCEMCMCSAMVAGNAATTAMAITGATKGLLDKAKGNVLGMEIVKDQSGYTLRVSQSMFYNRKLVHTFLKGHSILSLEGSLSGDCDVEKNDVGMLDKFDRGLQTDVQVFVDFDYAMGRSIIVMESRYELRLVAGIATGALVKGGSQSEVPAQVEVVAYRRLRQELVADVKPANNLLHELNRYLEQLRTRAPKLLRVEALCDDPLINFILDLFKEEIERLNAVDNPIVLVNTVDALEEEALKDIEGKLQLIAVGPLLPSAFLDGINSGDKSFGGDLFESSKDYLEWMNTKPEGSIVYISFGSLLVFSKKQKEAMAHGLLESGRPFLWVIRDKKEGEKQGEDEEDNLSFMKALEQLGLIVKTGGTQCIKDTIHSNAENGTPVTCLVYTILLPWVGEVARGLNVPSALLWIQPASVFRIYYYYFSGYGELIGDHCNEPSWSIELPGSVTVDRFNFVSVQNTSIIRFTRHEPMPLLPEWCEKWKEGR
nr:crocetin glucosyltransferase, chloroplastic-like [Tanacetum cinerariifolium]